VDQMPGPPPDIHDRKITVIEFNDRMFRTHAINRNPIYFGRSGQHRFDSPDGSFGVLYAGRDEYCAFIETFAKAAGSSTITTTELKNRCLAELKAARTLRLVDLTQSGTLFRLGADARLFSGDHTISQAWSKALYDHPFNIDGLLSPSRLDPARHALALFEGRAALVELNRQTWFATGPLRHVLAEIVEHYALAVIEEKVIPPRKPISSAIQERLK
jgi:hypothetical protein